MLLLNFGHPLTSEQMLAVEERVGAESVMVVEVRTHFDHQRPFPDQVTELINKLDISPQAWQTESILINPPAHNVIAVTLLAELHGRMGYFPAVIRLKPVPETTPPRFEFAEIVNLQALRDQARGRR